MATTTAVPDPAAAVGYDTQTFGPAVTLGSNWQKFNFFGVDPGSVGVTQNADGSVTIAGGGDNYGAQLSTASVGSIPHSFTGIAFGGGGYFQAVMSFTGPASFWANDIETMDGLAPARDQTSGLGRRPGTATGSRPISPSSMPQGYMVSGSITGSGALEAGTTRTPDRSPVRP